MTADERRLARNAYMRDWKKRNSAKVNAINLRVKANDPERYRRINRESARRVYAEKKCNPEWQIRYRANSPQKYLLQHLRARAKAKGLPFDLQASDIVIPTHCPVLGIKLEWGVGRKASANHASPSVDRLVPHKGYVRGNICVISNRANHLKNNATVEELEALIAYMHRELRRAA